MFRRSLPNELIDRLNASRFWKHLCHNANLQPEIRKDAITVYYRGGALLKELRLMNGILVADVNQKFIPLEKSATTKYVRLSDQADTGLTLTESLGPLQLGTCDSRALRAYMDAMDLTLTAFPEAEITQALCCQSKNCVLDQEIAFQESGESRDKIDLCHFDYHLMKLVFVEVKRKDDPRLLCREGRPEVLTQLDGYCQRLRKYQPELLTSYCQVVKWKHQLGLGHRLSQVPSDGPTELVDKPVLVIGNCTSIDVRRIKAGEGEWAPLMTGLKDVAAGLILCGTNGCRLNLVKGSQTISYLA